jgi:ABC-2 type transport system ATP-binding protein
MSAVGDINLGSVPSERLAEICSSSAGVRRVLPRRRRRINRSADGRHPSGAARGRTGRAMLNALPEVSSVRWDGEQLLVTGNSEALQAVIAVLARQGVIAQHLRVEQATLDDAFVALTGKPERI